MCRRICRNGSSGIYMALCADGLPMGRMGRLWRYFNGVYRRGGTRRSVFSGRAGFGPFFSSHSPIGQKCNKKGNSKPLRKRPVLLRSGSQCGTFVLLYAGASPDSRRCLFARYRAGRMGAVSAAITYRLLLYIRQSSVFITYIASGKRGTPDFGLSMRRIGAPCFC